MPFIVPLPTNGGPANPDKQGNLGTWWEIIHLIQVDDAAIPTANSIFQMQQHRSTAKLGGFGSWLQSAVRSWKGQSNTDPFRIIIAAEPNYWAIATSSTRQEIEADWMWLKQHVFSHLPAHKTAAELTESEIQVIMQKVVGKALESNRDIVEGLLEQLSEHEVTLRNLQPVQVILSKLRGDTPEMNTVKENLIKSVLGEVLLNLFEQEAEELAQDPAQLQAIIDSLNGLGLDLNDGIEAIRNHGSKEKALPYSANPSSSTVNAEPSNQSTIDPLAPVASSPPPPPPPPPPPAVKAKPELTGSQIQRKKQAQAERASDDKMMNLLADIRRGATLRKSIGPNNQKKEKQKTWLEEALLAKFKPLRQNEEEESENPGDF